MNDPNGACSPTDPSVDAFDRVFRERAGTLGYGTVTEEQELAMIRWRVEGALWLLGSMAGIVPAGVFNTQIPAVNYAAAPQSFEAPMLTVYGHGEFELVYGNGYDYYALAHDDDGDERGAMPEAFPVPNNPYPSGWEAIPGWIRHIYGDYGNYLYAFGSNPDVELEALDNVPAFIKQVTEGFRTLKCASGAGSLTFEGDGVGGQDPVGSFKTLARHKSRTGKWGVLCTTPKPDYRATLYMGVSPSGEMWSQIRDRLQVGLPSPVNPWSWRDINDVVPRFGTGDIDSAIPLVGGRAQMELLDDSGFCVFAPPSCQGQDDGMITFSRGCIEDRPDGLSDVCNPVGDGDVQNTQGFKLTHRMLRPTSCGTGPRVPAFVNSYPPSGNCGAAAELMQAIALACELRLGEIFPPPQEPPSITKPEDVPSLSRWAAQQSARAARIVSRLYLEDVPRRVVDDIRENRVGSGSKDGEHGRTVLQMSNSVRDIHSNWQRVSQSLALMSIAIDSLHADLAAAKIYENTTLAQLAIQRMQVHQTMVNAAASAVSSWGSTKTTFNPLGGAAQSLAAAATIEIGRQQLGKMDELEALAGETNANMMTQAFLTFEQTAQPLYAELENALRDIQSAVANTLAQASLLQQNMARAKYAAAKGAGEDFVMIDGEAVPLPVNTVLNRQYDITKLRYQRALEEAKYLAYVARLAIEQRIGMRLATIVEPVGPLEAPATWADDVCSLQGVDYERLRGWGDTEGGGDGGVSDEVLDAYSKEIVAEFADAYIGDYVAKLSNFVDYYNIDYPSHDGDDTAVLSLREDFLAGAGQCVRTAENRLYFSDQLHRSGTEGETVRGWQTRACLDPEGRCLRVTPGDALPPPEHFLLPLDSNGPPDEDGEGGVTWLHEVEGSLVPSTDGTRRPAGPPVPSVWQSLELEAGTYLLSWRDQARLPDGQLSVLATPSSLRVGVYDDAWVSLGAKIQAPYQHARGRPLWSERRTLEVEIPSDGVYHVVISVSLATEEPGSVAIANVQFEKTASPGAAPTAYVSSDLTRQHVTSACDDLTAAEMRQSFAHTCNASGTCFYELAEPLIIDTSALGTPQSYLNGKLASGNFNFRHITVAVNLVGTGVHDCDEGAGMSCYGSGFLEYTLNHDAFESGVVGWNEEEQFFNFGSAAINHGKALAAERYITLPIGSNDASLLGQPGIEKTEYRGRPLDGSYRLRIWDDGTLKWDRLEDVQIVLKYRYWSAIDAQP